MMMTKKLPSVETNHFLRVMLIGFIMLLLQIPIGLLHGVIFEREQSRDQAVSEVTSKWGERQALVGPVIVVPYKKMEREKQDDGKIVYVPVIDYAIFLPDELDVHAKVTSHTRYRGIYDIPVYQSEITVKGSFGKLDFSDWDISDTDILWNKAKVSIQISDVQALISASPLRWGHQELELAPGSHQPESPGVHTKLTQIMLGSPKTEFSFEMVLNGSQYFSVAPVGSTTNFTMDSNWPDPSFQGEWLPREKVSVTDAGFNAHWSVSLLGRNYPKRWTGVSTHEHALNTSQLGVRFLPPIDQYHMAFRSVKYELLFLVFVFMTLWLFEILSGIQIHSIQYVMVGVAMCLFYLLELSLAEHLGFVWAYTIAATMVCLLISGYCRAVLETRGRAVVVGGVLSLLYGFLYMLLVNQGYALLAGSLGLFGALAVVMYLTRNVEWGSPSERLSGLEQT